eukprot:TRINITY_DN1838_c0_g1_i3.p1 TRINITY_DN1838_c0_g1~~TRINITY_DN1838_c0_g1_i3.p1  ORF type:complete len:259 (+),score=43.79 TRINITY_DN1838_c0_g1_i3:92-868(+)
MEAVIPGIAAGVAEAALVQPLDLIKTRFQLNTKKNSSILRSAASIYREGGLSRFYRGGGVEIASIVVARSTCFIVFDSLKATVGTFIENDVAVSGATGVLAAIPEAVVVTPFQVVKIRMQSKECVGRYSSSSHCFRSILKDEGWLTLSSGLTATMFRNGIWTGIYFATMSHLSIFPTAVSGFLAGSFACLFNTPFDVVKSRLQLAPSGSTVPSLLLSISKSEGILSLYKGLLPKLLRMGVGGSISITVFTSVKSLMTV